MKRFLAYLKQSKQIFENQDFQHIHIVLGNETCDLDSMISALSLAYLRSATKPKNIPNDALILPVLNVAEENFPIRTENKFVLNECSVPTDLLIYRNKINFDKLLKEKSVTSSLVDHHVLSTNDEILNDTVIEVFDHRPIDPSMKLDKGKADIKITEVGSCATLIAEEIFRVDENILCNELAYLLYGTIVYDTVALKPENGRAKDLDIKIAEKIETKFKFAHDRNELFNILRKAHIDVSHLTPQQILSRDLKVVNTIPLPGLPMLVEDFLKLKNSFEAIKTFSKSYCSPLVVLIGLDASKEVKRDFAVFCKETTGLKDILLDKLKNAEKIKGYDFGLTEVAVQQENVICFRQSNIKLSRKQIIPLVKEAALEYFK